MQYISPRSAKVTNSYANYTQQLRPRTRLTYVHQSITQAIYSRFMLYTVCTVQSYS